MINTIIFDIGKVLVDYNWQDYLKSFGYNESKNRKLAEAVFLSEYWIETDRGVWTDEKILEKFVEKAPEYENEIYKLWEGMEKCITVFDYTKQWIAELKEKGYQVYYLSNYGKTLREKTKEALEFTKDCHGGIFSYEIKKIKPDSEIYQAFLKEYGLVPEQCVFIDDRLENILGAEAEGIHGILFENYQDARKKISKITKECQ